MRRRRKVVWKEEGTRRHKRGGNGRLLLYLIIPSLALNLLFAFFMQPEKIVLPNNATTYELDLMDPEQPALPEKVKKPRKKTREKKKARKRRAQRRVVRRRAQPQPAPQPAPKEARAPTPRPMSDLLRMRSPAKTREWVIPKPKVEDLRVDGHRIIVKRYADGGRLMSNVSKAKVVAPERAKYWRTAAAPRGDAARLSLAGLASILSGGKRGKVCDHFKDFPALSSERTVHLLIDSSPSMTGNITPAEVCAVGVAHSALQKGYSVAVGRFGSNTHCHPPTKRSQRIRDVIVNQRRIGGTLVPSTCGAHESKQPVDVVIITDGGFMKADLARMMEAQRAVAPVENRGMLYLVPHDRRFGTNPKALAAFRSIGFRIVHLGAKARRRAARATSSRRDGNAKVL